MDSLVCFPSLTITRVGSTLLCHRRMAQAPRQKGVCMFRAGFGGLGYPCFGVSGSSPCLTIIYHISSIIYIMYHISYIIYHISYIIYHISYIIYHIVCRFVGTNRLPLMLIFKTALQRSLQMLPFAVTATQSLGPYLLNTDHFHFPLINQIN